MTFQTESWTLRNLERYFADENNSPERIPSAVREVSNGRVRFNKNNLVRASSKEQELQNDDRVGSTNNLLAEIIKKKRRKTSCKVARSRDGTEARQGI